jgi:hypothetical protein
LNWTPVANSQAWSNYMAINNLFTHSWQNVVENTAAGNDSPENVARFGWTAKVTGRTF